MWIPGWGGGFTVKDLIGFYVQSDETFSEISHSSFRVACFPIKILQIGHVSPSLLGERKQRTGKCRRMFEYWTFSRNRSSLFRNRIWFSLLCVRGGYDEGRLLSYNWCVSEPGRSAYWVPYGHWVLHLVLDLPLLEIPYSIESQIITVSVSSIMFWSYPITPLHQSCQGKLGRILLHLTRKLGIKLQWRLENSESISVFPTSDLLFCYVWIMNV